MNILETGINAVERGYVPDLITRMVIRKLCGQRLGDLEPHRAQAVTVAQRAFVDSMIHGPIAPVPEKANEQHYELPAEFFAAVLGPHRKYSCCLWPSGPAMLIDAEEAALRATCEHAEIADGQNILELGCGWGSLSLWIARRYPNCRITAVSNSIPQRISIEAQAAELGLENLKVITADMNHFVPDFSTGRFDRVVSVEMFEHMRNYELLLARIAAWLKLDGKLFVHIFCHRQLTYPFETEGASNWMGRYFFTGGIMPGANLLRSFDRDLQVAEEWTWNGRHYQRTAEAWLQQLDAKRHEVLPVLKSVYGPQDADRWFHRWRMFFLAVSELFGYAGGQEWFVSHYLLQPTARSFRGISTNVNSVDFPCQVR